VRKKLTVLFKFIKIFTFSKTNKNMYIGKTNMHLGFMNFVLVLLKSNLHRAAYRVVTCPLFYTVCAAAENKQSNSL